MTASLLNVAGDVGYPVLFLLVAAEAGGVPVPGETALITAAVLASQGRLDLAVVIVVAAAAAIVGDNLGYLVGRKGGRRLLESPRGPFAGERRRVLEVGEPFFARHGPKAVFLGRWILGLRVWASWLAGMTHMRWPVFVFWNAAGGISWAVTIGVLAYVVGERAETLLRGFGAAALVGFALAVVALLLLRRRRRRRSPVSR